MRTYTLECLDVTKRFHKQVAIDHLSLSLPSHGLIGLVGTNGSGKTTLLKLLAGLLRPDEGEVKLDGQRVTRKMADRIAYLSDEQSLYDFYTVEEIIHYAAVVYPDFQIAKAKEMIQFLELQSLKKIKYLSKGNLARLKIVLALSRQVPFVLMDEILSGLDPLVRAEILKMFARFADLESQTYLISTHEINEIENYLDHVIFLNHGQLRLFASVEELREQRGQSLFDAMKEAYK